MQTHAPTEHELRDGRKVVIRPIRPDDAPRLVTHVQRSSAESRRLRFFSRMRNLDPGFASRLATVDFDSRAAFVATFPGDDEVRAVGRYERLEGGEAEVAFLVEDELQGQGVGPLLLQALACHARHHGVTRLVAFVLAENGAMLHVLRDSGFPSRFVYDAETVKVTLDVSEATCHCTNAA